MEFRFLPIFAVALTLALALSHAALPAEMYWKSVFPNTPIPKALRNLLLPAAGTKNLLTNMAKNENKGVDRVNNNYAYADPSKEFKGNKDMLTSMVKNGNKGVDRANNNYAYADPSKEFKGTKDMLTNMVKNENKRVDGANNNYAYADPSKEFKGTKDMLTNMVKNENKGVDGANNNYAYADPSKEFKGTKGMLTNMVKNENKRVDAANNNYAYADPSKEFKGTKNMLTNIDNKENKGVDGANNNYAYANPSKEFKGKNNMDKIANATAASSNFKDAYFFESDLHPGRKMNLNGLIRKPSKPTFLPRTVADSIPFSTRQFPEILKYYSLEPNSAEANLLQETIKNCERPKMKGEAKYCATSFESFIDSGVSKMGKNIQLLSNELEKETENPEFIIGQGVKLRGESEIVCHKLDYAYAVFLCHSIDKTALYTVPLVGANWTRARALAVCHKDTSAWNPKHLAFQVLNVKPGTVPICHFLVRDTLVWVPN